MVFDMVFAIGHAIQKHNFPQLTVIGMDVRPRLAMGSLTMHFLIEGQHVIVVKHPLHEDDPVWKFVVGAGFSTLPYASMIPAALPSVLPPDIRHM